MEKDTETWLGVEVGGTIRVLSLLFLGVFPPPKRGQCPPVGQEWVSVPGVSHFKGQLLSAFQVIPRRGLEEPDKIRNWSCWWR